MSPELARRLSPLELADVLGRRGPLCLLLDFDGTLVGIAPRPDEVQVPAGLVGLLLALERQGHVVALVTGRSRDDVLALLGHPAGITVVGLHGLEWPGEPAPPREARLDDVVQQVSAAFGAWPGFLIEDKVRAVAFHVRRVPAEGKADRVAALRRLLEEAVGGSPLSVLEGHEVLEVRPRAATKARAVERFARDHPGTAAVYIGDDETDEEAFRALPDHGLGVRVARHDVTTSAEVVLDDPEAVLATLRALAGP